MVIVNYNNSRTLEYPISLNHNSKLITLSISEYSPDLKVLLLSSLIDIRRARITDNLVGKGIINSSSFHPRRKKITRRVPEKKNSQLRPRAKQTTDEESRPSEPPDIN